MPFTSKDLDKTVNSVVAGLGFKKRAGSFWTLDLGGDVIGTLSLNVASKHTPAATFGVNPMIGLRHQHIEKIVADLNDKKFHQYVPPTVVTPIGYLTPENRFVEWTVEESNAEQQARAIGDAVGEHGLPFLRQHATLQGIYDLMLADTGHDYLIDYRLPVALYLADATDKAVETLDEKVNDLGDRTDAAAQRYRQFAERFRSMLET